MRQVDFYLISNTVTSAEFKLASRLANKLQALEKRVLLIAENDEDAAQLDNMLWIFSDTSFVAHDRVPANRPVHSSTHIALKGEVDDAVLANGYDVLINLATEVPECNRQFSRIAEIIASDEQAKAMGRQRYKLYQSQDIEIKTHPIEI